MTNEKIIKALDNIYYLLSINVIKGDNLCLWEEVLNDVLYPKIIEDDLKPFVTRYIKTLTLVIRNKIDVEFSKTEISNEQKQKINKMKIGSWAQLENSNSTELTEQDYRNLCNVKFNETVTLSNGKRVRKIYNRTNSACRFCCLDRECDNFPVLCKENRDKYWTQLRPCKELDAIFEYVK